MKPAAVNEPADAGRAAPISDCCIAAGTAV